MKKKKEESFMERNARKKVGKPARKKKMDEIAKKVSKYPMFSKRGK